MKKLVMLAALLTATQVYAQEAKCIKVLDKDTKVTWVAFKTPLKVGVGGSFTNVSFEKAVQGADLETALKQSRFSIDTKSVSTNDKQRDAKIVSNFFKNGNLKISGVVQTFRKKKLVMDLTMNDVMKTIPMSYEISGNKVTAKGFIDILDFNASDSLSALNKACELLHEGKTWSDVEIGLEFTTTKC